MLHVFIRIGDKSIPRPRAIGCVMLGQMTTPLRCFVANFAVAITVVLSETFIVETARIDRVRKK